MEPKTQEITHDESQSSAAAQKVASVDDLLIEIFLRLPVKPLIRFNSVSKHWQSLISDPGFTIRRNYPNPNSPATGLILQVDPPKYQRPDEMPAPYAYVVSFDNNSAQTSTLRMKDPWPCATRIRSSCNGLILMCRCYKISNDLPESFDYYVCNPTTNKYLKLPQTHNQPDRMLLPMCLAFDPSNSPHYKVVCALTYDTWYRFLVYSSEMGCWRISRVEPFQAASVDFRRGVYWNEAMHWVSNTNTGKSIYFDPDDDRMSQEMMPTPPILLRNKKSSYYFGESCGHLHYIQNCRNWRFDVYELRRDYSEWFVRYRINHHDPCSSVGRRYKTAYLCDVVRGKRDDDDSFSVLLIGGKLVRYYFLHKTRETICKLQSSLLSLVDLP